MFIDILGPLLDSKLHESRDHVCLGHQCNLRPTSVLGRSKALKKGSEEGREGEREGGIKWRNKKKREPREWCHQDVDIGHCWLHFPSQEEQLTIMHGQGTAEERKRTRNRNQRMEMGHSSKIKHSLLPSQCCQWFTMNKCVYSNVFIPCWHMTCPDQPRLVDFRHKEWVLFWCEVAKKGQVDRGGGR